MAHAYADVHTAERGWRLDWRGLYFNPPLIDAPGGLFENAVEAELFRAVANWNETGWCPFSLNYVHNKKKQEVDFLLAISAHSLESIGLPVTLKGYCPKKLYGRLTTEARW